MEINPDEVEKPTENKQQQIKEDLNSKINQYLQKSDNLQSILQNNYLTDEQKIQIQEKKQLIPQMKKINNFEENVQQNEYNQIIQDINNNKFLSAATPEDKIKMDSSKQLNFNYQDQIESDVQSKMDQIQKEAEEEVQKQEQKQKKKYNDQMNYQYLERQQEKTQKGQDLNTQLNQYQKSQNNQNNNENNIEKFYQQSLQNNNNNSKLSIRQPRFFELENVNQLTNSFNKNNQDVFSLQEQANKHIELSDDQSTQKEFDFLSQQNNNNDFYNPTHDDLDFNIM